MELPPYLDEGDDEANDEEGRHTDQQEHEACHLDKDGITHRMSKEQREEEEPVFTYASVNP